jgi:hypothetical protein
VVAVLVVLAIGLAVVMTRGDGGEGDGAGAGPAAGGAPSGGRGDEAASAAIEVVDQGFSSYEDSFGDLKSAFGVVVQNTSKQAYDGGLVEITAYDAGGNELGTGEVHTGLLLPGEKMGGGDELWTSDVTQPIARLDVRIHDASQMEDPPDGTYETAAVASSIDDLGWSLVTTFTLTKTYEKGVCETAVVGAVYRDDAGKIVGGRGFQATFEDGATTTPVELRSQTPIADVASTEVFASPMDAYLSAPLGG